MALALVGGAWAARTSPGAAPPGRGRPCARCAASPSGTPGRPACSGRACPRGARTPPRPRPPGCGGVRSRSRSTPASPSAAPAPRRRARGPRPARGAPGGCAPRGSARPGAPARDSPGRRASAPACRCRAAGSSPSGGRGSRSRPPPPPGPPRAGWPARAAGSAPAPRPTRSRARRSQRSAPARPAPARSAGRAPPPPPPPCPRGRASACAWLAMRSTAVTSATSDSTAADHIRGRDVVLGHHRQQPLARLRQRREALQRFERLASGAGRGPRSDGGRSPRGPTRRLRWAAPWPAAAAWWLLPACSCAPTLVSHTAQSVGRLVRGPIGRGGRSVEAFGRRYWLRVMSSAPGSRSGWGNRQRRDISSARAAPFDRRRRSPQAPQPVRASAASMRRQGLLATEQRDALEDPGRDRRAGERHAQRLVDLARLDATLGAARPRSASCTPVLVEARAPAPAPRVTCAERLRPPCSSSQRSRALASDPRVGSSKTNPASGQKSASVWIFSWLIATARSALADRRSSALGGPRLQMLGDAPRQLRDGQLADVHAVQPAQLRLVELRGVAAHALQREALERAARWTSPSRRPPRPSRAARGSCAPPPAGSRRRAAPAPRPRRGALRASCRRGRAAAAGARTPAGRGRRPSASSTSSCLGVFERWSSPRTTCVMPASRSSIATAKL